MSKFKVVITDREYENIENEKRILSEIGAEIFDYQYRSEEEIISVSKDCDALIIQYAKITDKIISNLRKCKIIAKYATGIETIDIESATKNGICVTNVSNYCSDEVSTHTLSLLLALHRNVVRYDKNVRSSKWGYKQGPPIPSLKKSIVGVIGFGKISSEYIRKLRPLCDEIWVHSKSASEDQLKKIGAQLKPFDEIIKYADFISIHSPLTVDTKGLFNKDVFAAMKPSASIINVSRGGVVKEDDLIWALENGEICSAALDVMEQEPPEPNSKLLAMENVILSPHMAWYSTESQKRLQSTVAQNVSCVLQGRWPMNLVNPELRGRLDLKE